MTLVLAVNVYIGSESGVQQMVSILAKPFTFDGATVTKYVPKTDRIKCF
jgi:hypothetical protein